MGSCVSCRSPCSFECVRVVRLNGFIADFDYPVTAKQVTEGLPKHFLCTLAHLVHGLKSIEPHVKLEAGHVYFLLPYSVLQSDNSPANMATLASRLAAIAKRSRSRGRSNKSKGARTGSDFQLGQQGLETVGTVRTWKPTLDTITEKSREWSTDVL